MSTDFLRNYIDIIKEAEQPKVQLDEGMMDTIKSLVPKAMKLLGGDTVQQIAQQVKQATGGDFTPSQENAIKVAKALGFDKIAPKKAVAEQQLDEVTWGLAGDWKGKLIQLLYTIGIAGSAVGGYLGAQPGVAGTGMGVASGILIPIGILLLMFADTFFGRGTGQVGAMGQPKEKHDNTMG